MSWIYVDIVVKNGNNKGLKRGEGERSEREEEKGSLKA